MSEIVLLVDGAAVGKARPRFNRQTGRTYTEARTAMAERRVQAAWHAAGKPRLDPGPIRFLLTIAVQRPKNHWRVNGELSAAGLRAPHPIRKPDVDNAIKTFMDSLNGLAYRDDVDVVHAWVVRRWCGPGEHEHARIVIAPAAEPPGVVGARRAA